jgi:DNA-directed RNA polymerase subunit RPC12/RpoP
MSAADASQDFINFECQTCSTRMFFPRDQAGRIIRCEMCGVEQVVPQPREKKVTRSTPPPVPSIYGLAEDDSWKEIGELILVECPLCGTRMHHPPSRIGHTVACPDCGTATVVREPPPKPAVEPPPKPTAYALLDDELPPKPPPVPGDHAPYYAARILDLEPKLPPPPKTTFFSQVWSTPFRSGALPRWLICSVGVALVGELVLLILFLIAMMSAPTGGALFGILALFVGVATVWLGVWTFGYLAACVLSILQDTANGADQIHNWPEPDWREWVWPMLFVGFQLALSASIGYGIGFLVSLATGQLIAPAVLTTYLLFPVFLVSAVIENHVLGIFSRLAWQSIAAVWWGWLVVYLLLGAMLVFVGGLALLGLIFAPFSSVPFIAPLAVASCFICARLLGRLVWKAAQVVDDPRS